MGAEPRPPALPQGPQARTPSRTFCGHDTNTPPQNVERPPAQHGCFMSISSWCS